MTVKEFRKYFRGKKPAGAITLLIFGVLFFLVASIGESFLFAGIGITLAIIGIYQINQFGEMISDDAVDVFCNGRAKEYFAFKKGIAEERGAGNDDIIFSCGYCFKDLFLARQAIRGKDNVWRSSIFDMCCLYFVGETAYYSSKKLSLITEERSETLKEFALQDIQLISIEELNRSVMVVIVIPGNEKLYIDCRDRNEAVQIYNRLRNRAYPMIET